MNKSTSFYFIMFSVRLRVPGKLYFLNCNLLLLKYGHDNEPAVNYV